MLVVGVTRDSLSLSSLCYCSFASAAAKARARAHSGLAAWEEMLFPSVPLVGFFCLSYMYVSVSAGGINANLIHHPSPRWLWCATKLWRCDLLLQGCKPSVFFVRCLCVCVCRENSLSISLKEENGTKSLGKGVPMIRLKMARCIF